MIKNNKNYNQEQKELWTKNKRSKIRNKKSCRLGAKKATN
jgi:hypothetical protein